MAKRAVYVPDASGKRLYALPVATDGALSSIGFLATAQGPGAVAMAPDGTHFYAAMADGSIASFDVAAGSSSLTPTGSSPFSGIATALAVSPSGNLLVAGGGGTVAAYFVSADGTLSAAPAGSGASFADRAVNDVAFDPSGLRLYVASTLTGGTGRLGTYGIGTDASLDPLDETAAGLTPTAIVVAPQGSRAYAADLAGDQLVGFSVATDGHLGTLAGSPYAAGDGPRSLAITSDGAWLIAANSNSATASSFRIGSGGTLSGTGSQVSVSGAQSVVSAPSPRHAYVGGSAKVAALDISTAGALSIRGAQAVTDGSHTTIAVSPDRAAVARFEALPGKAGYDSNFQADSSFDPDGAIASLDWDFGDGTTGHGSSPTHTYAQPGTYTVTLRAVDNEGCVDAPKYTGHGAACTGTAVAGKTITVGDPTYYAPPDQDCAHDGNDGFCGTADQKAPHVTVLGFDDGAAISTVDAPDQLVGTITPDPSGISSIRLRFTKADGTIITRRTLTRRVCRRVRGKKTCRTRPVYKTTCRMVKHKRRCTKKKVIKVTDSKLPACLTVSGTKNYLVKYRCSKVKWITVDGDTTFRYSLPVALGVGTYTVDAIATDGAGNADVLEDGRNHMRFTIVNTPSNQSSGGTTVSGGTTTTPLTPIDDTGSPFG
jgi:6-phosphogluconolactonase (cycloisomerase 2 family)